MSAERAAPPEYAGRAEGAAWPRLSAEEHGDLRRVRAIIQRLHHREQGEWGDPLDGCLAVLAKVIDNTHPTEPPCSTCGRDGHTPQEPAGKDPHRT